MLHPENRLLLLVILNLFFCTQRINCPGSLLVRHITPIIS